ncbi:helix-turn-helix domain-containing protein [Amycolatopsis taiwanensis]|uniref:helix-turn-helix domain-containing protein n=1 Tax=Amycolatopsis taiwanensis TaxID=342230 RepID=UPI0004880D17|nr:helix-turn-helix domain-containing protein [Amycolatopsis taiwanensis]
MLDPAVCCLIVDVDDFLSRSRSDGWADRTRRSLRRVIDDQVRDEAGASVQASLPDEWVLVLRSATAHELKARAEAVAAGIHRGVRAGRDVTVTVAVGQVVTGPNAIPDALSSARRAHRAKLTLGPDRVITVGATTGEGAVPIPHDVHRELARAIGRGEPDRASRLLWHWFSTALEAAAGDDETVRRWLLGQVLSATAALHGRLGTGTAADWMAVCGSVPYPALAELAELHEPAAVAAWIERVVAELAGQRRRTPSATLDLVRRYVDQHFTDPQLTLKGVALTVGVSPFHVSHLFRSELDTTFRDYVSQRRVRHAQRLLERTHLDMAQVARASGFGTPVQLRRVLVRETGTTPSAIRRSARERTVEGGSAGLEFADHEPEALPGATAAG